MTISKPLIALYPYKQTKPVCCDGGLIIYDMYNLQGLSSNVHLVMRPTTNALVKSNSVATLNHTWAHFVMVSQNVIRYFCKNMHPQGHLVIQYTHHMLIRNSLDSLNGYIYIYRPSSFVG
jgi:hypothetical protein